MRRVTPPRDIMEALHRAMSVLGIPDIDADADTVEAVIGHACGLLNPGDPAAVRASVWAIWRKHFTITAPV